MVFTRQDFPIDWAATQSRLASAYFNRIRGSRADNIEQAIYHSQEALQVWTQELFPADWAMIQKTLALAYLNRAHGERADNIEKAISYDQQALEVYTQADWPLEWGAVQFRLAFAYRERVRGEQKDNIEKAIFYSQQALKVCTRAKLPLEWAKIQSHLATLHLRRLDGERTDNLQQVIVHGEQALKVLTKAVLPVDWASAHAALASAYANRIPGGQVEDFEKAINHSQQALQVFTKTEWPVEWAAIQNRLGLAYQNRIDGDRADNIEKAIVYYQETLSVFTKAEQPRKWAQTQASLALAYEKRVHGERRANLERAIDCYQEALQGYTKAGSPGQLAAVQVNLGIAYRNRINGDRADNVDRAIFHYEQALKAYTKDSDPFGWGIIQINLATAYSDRVRGDREENLEQAIVHSKKALKVYTKSPEQWANAQDNLAHAYRFRIRGEKAENLEQAISHYEQALQVHTKADFPFEWAMTNSGIGVAYLWRVYGERADNIETAMSYFTKALEVYTPANWPTEWAMTQNNVALAYSDRIRGTKEENLKQAIATYQKVLKIHTLTTTPNMHRQTQRSLGALCFRERRWPEAYMAYSSALRANKLLYQASGTTEARQLELQEVRSLPIRAAYCLAELGRFSEAVETLEQGKAQALAEALARQEALLERASAEDKKAFTDARERIREFEAEARVIGQPGVRDFLAISKDLGQARSKLSETIERIRTDMPDFMPEGLDFFGIKSVAEALNQPLIYLLTTSHGSLALLVPPNQTEKERETSSVEAIWLNDFQADELSSILYQKNAQRYLHGTVEGKTNVLKTVLDEIWPRLNNKVMRPIATRLSELGYQQALLIPTGVLSLLPLHAICHDSVIFTLAPSVRALQSAQVAAKQRTNLPLALLGIGNPSAKKHQPLAFARLEVTQIAPLFAKKRTFYEKKATRKAVESHVAGVTHLHFSCHGAFNMQQPLSSALYLAGIDTLTLRDLLDGGLDLSAARLAVLSACQTGITDFQNVPDEAIGFPAGFLQAGVPGVISTLWPVMDISTALLLARFYRYYLEDGLALPRRCTRHKNGYVRLLSGR